MQIRGALISLFIIFLFTHSSYIFAQNQKAEGYRGLWSSSGRIQEYGYRYSGGLGTFSSHNSTVAIYSPEVKKTFFVYSGTTLAEESHLQIMISYFDHRKGKVPKPVIVYDKMGVNDPRDNASIAINSAGYIWVFISGSGRTRPGLIFRSSEPYSIEKFDEILQGEIVFPQPWWINDSCLFLMYTKIKSVSEPYWSYSSDGKTWPAGQKLSAMGGSGLITGFRNNTIVCVFNYFPEGNADKQTNLYMVRTKDMGKTWETVDNKIVETPVSGVHNEALIKDYEAENKLVYIKDLNFDSEGNPVILAITSRDSHPGPAGDPREWVIIHRKDNKWNFSKVCESLHNYDLGSLYITGDVWKIIGPTEPGPQKYGTGGEIALWESKDKGLTWEKNKNITTNSLWNNSNARRPVNAAREFYSFWANGDPGKLSVSQLYFTDESCNRVWVLPYKMTKNFEKPKRIK
jgi:hypothetical protein